MSALYKYKLAQETRAKLSLLGQLLGQLFSFIILMLGRLCPTGPGFIEYKEIIPLGKKKGI